MFSKNNIKYISILGLGFLWCSLIYLNQELYLLKYMSEKSVFIVDMLFGSFAMALGIFLFSFMYKRKINVKKAYIAFLLICITLITSFYIVSSTIYLSVVLCLICILGTAGFGAAYHFSLISCNVSNKYRGRVFALGYSIGTVLTYLLSLLSKNFLLSGKSLLLYIPMIILNIILIIKYGDIIDYKEDISVKNSIKKYKHILFSLVFIMAIVSAFSSNIIAINSINSKTGFAYSRIYYSIGLLMAGIISDYKKREYLDVITIISLFFPLLAILLLKENINIKLLSCLNYMFLGFFVIFRTTTFMNLKDKSNSLLIYSAYGLLISRIAEGLISFLDIIINIPYITLIIIIVLLLSIIFIIYIFGFYKINERKDIDIIKELGIKYKLSTQELRILELILSNHNNQEIADKLFLSINTVKTHIGSIYKKTGKKKRELQSELLISK